MFFYKKALLNPKAWPFSSNYFKLFLLQRPPSGVLASKNCLFFVREFVKMKKNVREFVNRASPGGGGSLQNVQFKLRIHARLLVFVYFSEVFHGKAEFSNVRTTGCESDDPSHQCRSCRKFHTCIYRECKTKSLGASHLRSETPLKVFYLRMTP